MNHEINHKPFMANVTVRPVRIAYFVPENDAASLRSVLQLVSTQWGGIYHLIIPWSKPIGTKKIYSKWLQLFDPDRFVAFLGKADEMEQLKSDLEAILPHRKVVVEDGPTFIRYDETEYALHAITKEEREKVQIKSPRISTDNEFEELLVLAMFGRVYPGQEDDYGAFIAEEQLTLDSPEIWKSQFDAGAFSSIINLTSYRTRIRKVSNLISFGGIRAHDGFTLVFIDSLASLCLYWNIRAVQEVALFDDVRGKDRRVIGVPLSAMRTPELFQNLFRGIRELLFFPSRTADIDVYLVTPSEHVRAEVETILQDSKLAKRFEGNRFKGNKITLGNPRNEVSTKTVSTHKELRYLLSYPMEPSSFYEGISGAETSIILFNYGNNIVRVERPSGYVMSDTGQVALDIGCDVWNRYPIRSSTDSLITPNSRLTPHGLSILTSMPKVITLELPEERATLLSTLKLGKYDVEQSKIGQYSDALIKLVGGISGIKLLSQEHVLRLLQGMASLSTLKLAQKLSATLNKSGTVSKAKAEANAAGLEIALREIGITSNIDASPKSVQQLLSMIQGMTNQQIGKRELLQVVEQLCFSKLIQRGYSIECPNCGRDDWHSLNELDDNILCHGCYHEYQLPIRESKNQVETLQWRFRLNPLVDRVLDQDLLVGLLAVYNISGKGKAPTFGHTFGLNIIDGSRRITDLDFVFVKERLIVAGECKSGAVLTEKDFANATLASSLGCDDFYFCTLSEFEKDTMDTIEQLKSEFESLHGMRINVLQRNDLLTNPQNSD